MLFLDYWENRILVPSSKSQKLQVLQISHRISIPHTACIRIPSLDLPCPGKAPLIRADTHSRGVKSHPSLGWSSSSSQNLVTGAALGQGLLSHMGVSYDMSCLSLHHRGTAWGWGCSPQEDVCAAQSSSLLAHPFSCEMMGHSGVISRGLFFHLLIRNHEGNWGGVLFPLHLSVFQSECLHPRLFFLSDSQDSAWHLL